MSLSAASYSRAFEKKFSYGNNFLSSREGVLLRFTQGDMNYFAEAAPLPSHSKDSVDDVWKALKGLGAKSLEEMQKEESLPPSLRFALETLALEKSSPAFITAVATNALASLDASLDLPKLVPELKARGYGWVKLKIFPEHAGFLKGLLAQDLGVRWRLDANQGFSPEEIGHLFESIPAQDWQRVEYVEEPLKDWNHAVLRNTPVELAADESAPSKEAAFRLIDVLGKVPVFIVKPTVWGGFRCLESLAEEIGWERVVVTSCLESEVGRRAILKWLGSGIPLLRPAGLSTGSLFEENYLEDRAQFVEIPLVSEEERRWITSLDWKAIS